MAYAAISEILMNISTIVKQELISVLGVEKELKKLESQLESIKRVIDDADKRQFMEKSVNAWLEDVQDICYEIDDILVEWMTASWRAEMKGDGSQSSLSRKVSSLFTFPCLCFTKNALRRDLAIKIKKINGKLADITVQKERYKFNEVWGNECFDTPLYIAVSEFEGRDVDKENLIGRLLCDENQEKGQNLNVISIVGMGGIGKTSLAKLVFNCDEVVSHFDRTFWVCVSALFDEVRIAKAILEEIEKKTPNLFELETVLAKIRNNVEGKRYLLVLDDVWTDEFGKWDPLLNSLKTGKAGSTILLTTRKKSVARLMGSSYQLCLERLSEVDSWTLFEKMAFFERKREDYERLEKVGRKIAEKCKGLPLSIKIIGGLMRFKRTLGDWEDVLNSKFWELEVAKGVFPPLMLSYYDLPSNVKPCFLYCAIFPKDHVIETNNLIQLWMAGGFLTSTHDDVEVEVVGQNYLQNLVMRSFFQDVVRDEKNRERIVSVKMHDMVHDLAHYLTRNEYSLMEFNNNFQREMESSHKRVRHLTVLRVEDAQFPNVPNVGNLSTLRKLSTLRLQSIPNFPNLEKLSTLRIQSFYGCSSIISQIDRVGPGLIHRLPRVRALDFSLNGIGELPKEIGNLIKLKFLNLSHNPLWELPDTVCDLYNLLSLKLSACDRLRRLPSRIYKLENLRHLEIDGTANLTMLPKGVADLASLRTLNKFIVFPRTNDRSNVGACDLGDLQNLNKLRGSLKIEGLGYTTDAAEATLAELRKKIHLSHLEMDFSPALIQNQSQDAVIEALEAPPNLESLQITHFRGTQFPKWMMKLPELQSLLLKDCQNCVNLPPLGTLTSLETLHLEGLNNLKCLNLGSTFPSLQKLEVWKMESWEEWNVMSSDQSSVNSMPRLRCLEISHCRKLKAIPRLLLRSSPLRKLHIENCPLLHQHYNKETGELWSEISHVEQCSLYLEDDRGIKRAPRDDRSSFSCKGD